MRKKDDIVSYTAEQLAEMRKRGGTRSNWAKAAALTNEEIEAQITADPDEAGMVIDWDSATIELPKPKASLHMRIDRDVLEFFRKTGRGYQTRINAVLRSYVERARRE
ncbi:MAG: BrnA antitoxin family protein [Acetobacteraceae bacterium]